MKVHLFRHGEVRARGCIGQRDVPLTPRGWRQSHALARRYRRDGRGRVVYSSDLSRCASLAALLGEDVTLTTALREQAFGAWEGRTWDELGPLTDALWADYVRVRPPGGESFGDLYRRVVDWWSTVGHAEEIVIVAHAGSIRALLCAWLRLDPNVAMRLAPAFASRTLVHLDPAGGVLERFGEVCTGGARRVLR